MLHCKLLVFCWAVTAASCHYVHFYRKDYVYIENFDAYYKLHWDNPGLSFTAAFKACEDEGARLFYPKEQDEWTVVKTLAASQMLLTNETEIFVGIHDEFGIGEFITIDGQPTPSPLPSDERIVSDGQHCLVMDVATGSYSMDQCTLGADASRPFVCKRIDDKPCPTIDRGYTYSKETKKCYKINKTSKTWQEAELTCFMEGGTLLVIENEMESRVIYGLTLSTQLSYFAGFAKKFSDDEFHTVKGKTLDEGFYYQRYRDFETDQRCGVVLQSNRDSMYTYAADCVARLPFICEMPARIV